MIFSSINSFMLKRDELKPDGSIDWDYYLTDTGQGLPLPPWRTLAIWEKITGLVLMSFVFIVPISIFVFLVLIN